MRPARRSLHRAGAAPPRRPVRPSRSQVLAGRIRIQRGVRLNGAGSPSAHRASGESRKLCTESGLFGGNEEPRNHVVVGVGVRIPRARCSVERLSRSPSQELARRRPGVHRSAPPRSHILVAEDNAVNRSVIVRMLRRARLPGRRRGGWVPSRAGGHTRQLRRCAHGLPDAWDGWLGSYPRDSRCRGDPAGSYHCADGQRAPRRS